MDLHAEIENMFDEIISYGGNFGDPIATEFTFEPLPTLLASGEDEFVRCGAGVGLLVDFSVCCDNYDYRHAVENRPGNQMRKAIEAGLLTNYPSILNAMNAAFVSEGAFENSLRELYKQHIAGWRENA